MNHLFYFFFLAAFFATVSPLNAQTNPAGVPLIETQIQNDTLEEIFSSIDQQTLEDLKAKEFDFNQKDTIGNTPLYYVLAKNQDSERVAQLVSYGADVNEPLGNGLLPLNITTSKANELQLQIMMMKTMGLDVSAPEVQEMLKEKLFKEMNRMIENAKILIENGADVNKESPLGTPLVNAVTNAWNQEIVGLLLKAGANVNWQDSEGRTALFYAAAGGNEDIITMLLKAGADPNIQDKAGKVYLDVEKIGLDQPI